MNATVAPTYRTLFVFNLIQTTAMSAGGTDQADAVSDMPLTRDGKGRLVLRGTMLAGHLLATARTFLQVPASIAWDITERDSPDIARPPSIWDCWDARLWSDKAEAALDGEPDTALRAGAPHRQDTRTSANRFDTEVVERGCTWRSMLEVRHERGDPDPGVRAAAIAALALREWHRGRCWLGRRVARGLGWMRLEDCRVYILPATEKLVDVWPNAMLGGFDEVNRYLTKDLADAGAISQTLDEYLGANAGNAGEERPKRAYVRWPLTITAGEYQPAGAQGAFGLDALSIGGHGAALPAAADFGKAHFARAREQQWEQFEEAFEPDFAVATERCAGKTAPLIAGSAVAGALRADISRRTRTARTPVLDPVTGERYFERDANGVKILDSSPLGEPDPVAALFGQPAPPEQPQAIRSSALLFSDAHVCSDDWLVALLEKVALDEFDQSVYPGAKFDRIAVLRGVWSLDLVQEVELVEGQTRAGPDGWTALVASRTEPVCKELAAGARRRIGLGGGEFRAYGHVAIDIRVPGAQWAPAGEEWQQLPETPEQGPGGDRHTA